MGHSGRDEGLPDRSGDNPDRGNRVAVGISDGIGSAQHGDTVGFYTGPA